MKGHAALDTLGNGRRLALTLGQQADGQQRPAFKVGAITALALLGGRVRPSQELHYTALALTLQVAS